MRSRRAAQHGVGHWARHERINLPSLSIRVPRAARVQWHPNWKSDLFEQLDVRSRGLLDVGANSGQSMVDFLAAGGRRGYLGFEPIAAQAALADQVLRASPLEDSAVVAAALSDRHGLLPIFVPDEDDTSASTREGLRPGRTFERHLISVHPYDELNLEAAIAPHAGVIKIDVEGSELEVLLGMDVCIGRDRPVIVCEVLDRDVRADEALHDARLSELEHLLHDWGYEMYRIFKPAGRLEGTMRIDSFPRRTWTEQDAEQCDYLFKRPA